MGNALDVAAFVVFARSPSLRLMATGQGQKSSHEVADVSTGVEYRFAVRLKLLSTGSWTALSPLASPVATTARSGACSQASSEQPPPGSLPLMPQPEQSVWQASTSAVQPDVELDQPASFSSTAIVASALAVSCLLALMCGCRYVTLISTPQLMEKRQQALRTIDDDEGSVVSSVVRGTPFAISDDDDNDDDASATSTSVKARELVWDDGDTERL